MAYTVTITDITSRWRPLSDAEAEVAVTLIQDAILLIDTQRPMLADLVDAGEVPNQIIAMTVAEMCQRVLRNPDVLRGANVGADGGVGAQFDQTGATKHKPRMRLEPGDLDNIDAAISVAPSYEAPARVRSIRTALSSPYGPYEPDMNALPLP